MVLFLLGAVFGAVSLYLIQKGCPKFFAWLDAEVIAIKNKLHPK